MAIGLSEAGSDAWKTRLSSTLSGIKQLQDRPCRSRQKTEPGPSTSGSLHFGTDPPDDRSGTRPVLWCDRDQAYKAGL